MVVRLNQMLLEQSDPAPEIAVPLGE